MGFLTLSNMISGFSIYLSARLRKSSRYEAAIQERIKTYQGLKKQISNIVSTRQN